MKKKVLIKVLLILLLLFAIIIFCFIEFSPKELYTVYYSIPLNITGSIRIVQLTDLHNVEFGEDNEELIKMVDDQNPDIIFMIGDMLNEEDENTDISCSLIQHLCQVAPIYFSYGNHEKEWEIKFQMDLRQLLTDSGAIVLDCEYQDVVVKNQELRIGGYYGYYRQPGMITVDEQQKALEFAFADSFEDTEDVKLLLCHIPTAWVDWEYIDKYPIDVVFSGHYHGGQVRLPIIGGLYAPYIGLFPPNTRGVFSGTKAVCVLSTGLGSESCIPRINNPPEVMVVDLLPNDK